MRTITTRKALAKKGDGSLMVTENGQVYAYIGANSTVGHYVGSTDGFRRNRKVLERQGWVMVEEFRRKRR
jgi:hypothetical protein